MGELTDERDESVELEDEAEDDDDDDDDDDVETEFVEEDDEDADDEDEEDDDEDGGRRLFFLLPVDLPLALSLLLCSFFLPLPLRPPCLPLLLPRLDLP